MVLLARAIKKREPTLLICRVSHPSCLKSTLGDDFRTELAIWLTSEVCPRSVFLITLLSGSLARQFVTDAKFSTYDYSSASLWSIDLIFCS